MIRGTKKRVSAWGEGAREGVREGVGVYDEVTEVQEMPQPVPSKPQSLSWL